MSVKSGRSGVALYSCMLGQYLGARDGYRYPPKDQEGNEPNKLHVGLDKSSATTL
jgi:hypothetical protein